MSRRFTFRPDALAPLDPRIVPSHIVPTHVAPMPRIINFGQLATTSFSQQTSGISHATPAARLRPPMFSYATSANFPDKAAVAAGADPNVVRFEINFNNAGNTPITGASLTERLRPKLSYIPGSAQPIDGGEVKVTTLPNRSTVLQWTLPNAIPVGATSTVSFEARYNHG